MQVDFVIMCGGYGSRLKPFTYIIPKPFLTANNISPFEYTLRNIPKKLKVRKIFVTVFYKKDFIKKKLKKQNENIQIIIEKEAMGTAGSLRTIVKKDCSRNIIITNGDIYSKIDYKKLLDNHIKSNSDITMCIKSHKINIPYAVMSKKKNQIFFKEKPVIVKKINAGIYVIKKNFLVNFFMKNRNNFVNMNQLFENEKKINIFDIGNKWIDIGHINDFKRAYNEIKKW